MSDFFGELGKRVGGRIRKGNWLLQSLTGTDDERLGAELRFGRDLAAEVRSLVKVPETKVDRERGDELKELGALLAARVANKQRRFDFTIIDSGPPNAFALPGGFVFIEQSLLQFCRRDRDEVGFILGHEMGHVIRGHAFEKAAGGAIFDLLGRTLVPGRGHVSGLIQQVARRFLQQAYSREQELDADRFGVALSRAAGLDPQGAVRFFERLREHAHAPAQTGPSSYFSTHPPVGERIREIARYLESLG